jgi:hypothetical protein
MAILETKADKEALKKIQAVKIEDWVRTEVIRVR